MRRVTSTLEALMLAPGLVREIQWLLVGGRLSQREIARKTAVARSTVGIIASKLHWDELPEPPGTDDEPVGQPARCPDCGGKVYLPCRTCQVRAEVARHHPRQPSSCQRVDRLGSSILGNPLGLELKPPHRERYEQVRARRKAMQPQFPLAKRESTLFDE
jgi:hypothetical protein